MYSLQIFKAKWHVAAGLFLIAVISCSNSRNQQTATEILTEHIEWLAADEREGRLAGTIREAESANYISDLFSKYGLIPLGDEGTWLQHFILTGPVSQSLGIENHIARNVIGMVEGTKKPGQFIILGAHFDSQGRGGVISMHEDTVPAIHNGADDNASGTAGLIYLANRFAEYPPEISILFIAFSGEEVGLQGARYFTEHMEIEKDSVLAMINLDMIGRMEEDKLTIFGTGTADIWEKLLEETEQDSLNISLAPGGSGASDHAAFYEAGIPVLHYFTGTHADYHRESDTVDKINTEGMERVLNHVENVIHALQRYTPDEIQFKESTDPRESVMRENSVALGVLPDYSFSGEGFRIEGVREGQPAAMAGMQGGDIILQMGGVEIRDIYNYMEILGEFEKGEEVNLSVLRDGNELELTVTF